MPNTRKKTNKGVNPIAVGVAGAAMVAAGAAAVALSKKENRKKAGKFLNKAKSSGKALGVKAVAGLDKIQSMRSNMETPAKSGDKKRSSAKKPSSKKKTSKAMSATHGRTVNSKMVN